MKKLLSILVVITIVLTSVSVFAELTVEEKHERMIYPAARITYGAGGGSGTVIYSKEFEPGKYSTYLITNCHVIWQAISFVKEPGEQEEKERRNYVWTEIFMYRNLSDPIGTYKIKTSILEYDKDKDIAILRLESEEPVKYIASLKPADSPTYVSDKVSVIGCPVLLPPYYVEGVLSQKGRDLIDALEYWMTQAPIVSGNSGGAIYDENGFFIGIPSRVVSDGWYVSNQIPHLGVIIPIQRIYDVLEEWGMQFLYDDAYTEEEYLNPPEKEGEE
jgi:S1-C subfamily serine protease